MCDAMIMISVQTFTLFWAKDDSVVIVHNPGKVIFIFNALIQARSPLQKRIYTRNQSKSYLPLKVEEHFYLHFILMHVLTVIFVDTYVL